MTVSAIVCAHNEEKTVKPILQTLLDHPKVSEVIVVDDGSVDHTWQQIAAINNPKLISIRHELNQGKGAAIVTAVEKSRGEILLFIDADLHNFHPSHIDLLLAPLFIDSSIMTIGVREVIDWKLEKTFKNWIKSFGGERALSASSVIPLIGRIKRSGYGVEAILNLSHLHKGKDIVYVPLPRLRHKGKIAKHPMYQFLSSYIKENTEIIKQYLSPENKALEGFLKQVTKKLGV